MRILFLPKLKRRALVAAGPILALLLISCDRPARNDSVAATNATPSLPAAAVTNPAVVVAPVMTNITSPTNPAPGSAGVPPAPLSPTPGTAIVTTAAATTNAVTGTNLLATTNTNAPATTNAAVKPPPEPLGRNEEIQLSFQGANIEMVVQWLAKTTGKSVVKHPRVQCQLTIVSSRKTTAREAINLVYRALSLEGFATIESSNAILIVPEGSEPKMSPEMMDTASSEIPDGRQRLMKVFPLKNISPAEAKDKLKVVLSEKGTVDADDRGGKIIVTDYTDNLRLVVELLPELDVVSISDTVIQIFPLKFLQADELASLLELVLNEKAGTPASPRSSPIRSSRSYSSSGMYFMESMPSPPSSSPAPSTSPAADGKIKLWPDKNSNRLIVSAPRSKIPEIERLIGVLDTAKPADVAIRVIPLKNVNAVDLARELAPVYQKLGGQSAKDMIEITSNERANSLIVLSGQNNFKGIQELVAGLDTEEAQERLLRTFPLQNADAEDVAEQLRQLNTEPNPFPRFFYYGMPSQQRSGKLSVVADRRRNTVIAQGPAASMEGIAEMIAALDAPVEDNSLAPKIFPLKYVSAVDLVEVLNELFLKKQPQRTYWNPYSDFGNQPEKDPNVGRLYGKVRITSEPYANALIVTANSPENLVAVEEIVKQLDMPSQAGESTVKLALKFAEAVPMANSLNILFARGGSPPLRQVPQQGQPQDGRATPQNASALQGGFQLEQEKKEETYFPWLGGQPENVRGPDGTTTMRPASELVGRVRVVPDNRSNALLITANVHFLAQVLKLINDLDAPTAQVLIEAKIIEVGSDFRDRLGVRWSPDGSQVYDAEDLDGSIMPTLSADYTRFLAGSGSGNNINSGILEATVNLDLLIQFLRKNTDATVLAQPQINVSDNELGKLFVGSQVPFISSSLNTAEGGRNDSFQYKDVGIILEVTPHINNSEEVALKIHAESSNIRSGQTLFGGAILDTRNFHTELLVKHGQTVVLGGIIQREDGTTIRKVPILGDIPGLGWLFKKRDKTSRNLELMVFLRPRITRTPEEANQLLHDMQENAPKVKEYNKVLK